MEQGAVGEIASFWWFNRLGRLVELPQARPIGLGLDGLAEIVREGRKVVAVVAASRARIAPLRVALEQELVNVLVTDQVTAQELLTDGEGNLRRGPRRASSRTRRATAAGRRGRGGAPVGAVEQIEGVPRRRRKRVWRRRRPASRAERYNGGRAVQYFLKLQGMEGESTDARHRRRDRGRSRWSWGRPTARRPPGRRAARQGGRRRAGRVTDGRPALHRVPGQGLAEARCWPAPPGSTSPARCWRRSAAGRRRRRLPDDHPERRRWSRPTSVGDAGAADPAPRDPGRGLGFGAEITIEYRPRWLARSPQVRSAVTRAGPLPGGGPRSVRRPDGASGPPCALARPPRRARGLRLALSAAAARGWTCRSAPLPRRSRGRDRAAPGRGP